MIRLRFLQGWYYDNQCFFLYTALYGVRCASLCFAFCPLVPKGKVICRAVFKILHSKCLLVGTESISF